jgi:hypothetical protein
VAPVAQGAAWATGETPVAKFETGAAGLGDGGVQGGAGAMEMATAAAAIA